jgi:hypothetical protein
MGRHVKVKVGGEWIDGEELDFEPLKESWNEYRCSDGAYVKLKTVVSKITRLDRTDDQGVPVYLLASSNVVAATPPSSS